MPNTGTHSSRVFMIVRVISLSSNSYILSSLSSIAFVEPYVDGIKVLFRASHSSVTHHLLQPPHSIPFVEKRSSSD